MEKDNLKEEDFDQELHEHFAFKIDSGQEPLRIDKFLMSRIENATRNKIQKAAKEGSIRVNDKIVKSSYKVKKNDEIKILFTHPPYENLLTPEKIELDVVYEDDYIIIVNKESGMVVHPGHGNYSGTLINALLYHFENLPNKSTNRPGLVHRIDKDTTGLLVIAKTEISMTLLAKQFFKKTVENAIILVTERIVTFSYAHVPSILPRQKILENIGFPSSSDKALMYENSYKLFTDAGYVSIGMDHFSKPGDEFEIALKNKQLHRNFQGYCTRETTGQVYALSLIHI